MAGQNAGPSAAKGSCSGASCRYVGLHQLLEMKPVMKPPMTPKLAKELKAFAAGITELPDEPDTRAILLHACVKAATLSQKLERVNGLSTSRPVILLAKMSGLLKDFMGGFLHTPEDTHKAEKKAAKLLAEWHGYLDNLPTLLATEAQLKKELLGLAGAKKAAAEKVAPAKKATPVKKVAAKKPAK